MRLAAYPNVPQTRAKAQAVTGQPAPPPRPPEGERPETPPVRGSRPGCGPFVGVAVGVYVGAGSGVSGALVTPGVAGSPVGLGVDVPVAVDSLAFGV